MTCLGPGVCVTPKCGWRKPCGACECRTFEAYFVQEQFEECPPNHEVSDLGESVSA